MITSGNERTFETYKKQLPVEIIPLFSEIRDYCFSLSEKVIEDVRMHRIVFCKSIAFRWFLDISSNNETGITMKIQRGRKEPFIIKEVSSENELNEIKPIIKNAFDSIN